MLEFDGTFIVALISFLIFLFIIKKILFQPISKVIDEREKFYAKNSKMETDSKQKSKNLLDEKEQKLMESRLEAGSIVKNATEEARSEFTKKITETKDEIKAKTDEKKAELENECKIAKSEIKQEVSNIVSSIASKVLGEDIRIDVDENKIEEYLR